jgi:hypothetical protein
MPIMMETASSDGLAGFEIAKASLACAMGLPGSENLDRDACLAWLDKAAAWTWQPADLENSAIEQVTAREYGGHFSDAPQTNPGRSAQKRIPPRSCPINKNEKEHK